MTALPDAPDKARVVEAMFDRIAPRYDVINRIISFRLDMAWRRGAVAALRIPPGSLVLDLACGTGDLCRCLDRAGHRAIGVDFSSGMLHAAHTLAPLVRGDALCLPFGGGTFDALTCGFGLRNFTDLRAALVECARVVRPGGRVALLEVAEPASPIIHAVHGVWFRGIVPRLGALLSDRAAYRYLPASTSYMPAPADLLALLGDCGFVELYRRALGLGAAQLVVGTRA